MLHLLICTEKYNQNKDKIIFRCKVLIIIFSDYHEPDIKAGKIWIPEQEADDLKRDAMMCVWERERERERERKRKKRTKMILFEKTRKQYSFSHIKIVLYKIRLIKEYVW